MRRELKNVLIMLAMLLVMAVAAVIVIHNASGEAAESPDLTRYVRIISDDGISLSTAPVELIPAELLRMSVDKKAIQEKDWLEADISLPYIPVGIKYLILTDGQHITMAVWEQTGEHTIHVKFSVKELREFSTPEVCYLVILTEWRNQ
ncbi:MAG: hypothetical protein IKO52_09210 [Clostridia bacterium]|nr:hypothetical protein [Clostridia bacterium]